MELSFYKNLEFMVNRYFYDIDNGQEKATFYVQTLNQLDDIIQWLQESIKTIRNSPSDYIRFKGCKSWNIDIEVAHLIEKEFKKIYNKEREDLHTMKEHYKNLKLKEEQEPIEESKSILSSLQKRITRCEERLQKKDFLISDIENKISFLNMHRNKVEYFILKTLKFKENISKNEINSFFSYKIDLPAYSQELYFEHNGTIKHVQSFYNKIANLPEQEKRKLMDEFFNRTNFSFMNKYDVQSIDELLNIYFNQIIENKITIKKCKNCGKYFIAHNKQVYCDNPSPQNKDITCRRLSDDMKEKTNKIYEAYRKTYKTQHNKLKRYIDTGNIPESKAKERFQFWNKLAISKKNTCKTVDEYNKWYKESLNWIRW